MENGRESFKDKPLKFCLKYLENSAQNPDFDENEVKNLVLNLIESKRLLDISSLYVFLKRAAANNRPVGVFYDPIAAVLKCHINELFTKSITYNNVELRSMFSDILGSDTGLLMELVSYIFKKYHLFDMKFSDNIHRQLIKVAEEDLLSFIEHADSHFLSFYLSSLPKLNFVLQKHIRQWVHVILYQINSEKYTSKILDALQIYPTLDFLLIFLLSSQSKDRFRALVMIRDVISSGKNKRFVADFEKKAPYFLKKALENSLFYDFHTIPEAHKEIFAWLLCCTDGSIIKETVLPMMKIENESHDAKIMGTKLIFLSAVKYFAKFDPSLIPQLTIILRDPAVETEVKEVVRKIINNLK